MEHRQNLVQGGPTERFQNRYRHKDGSYRWLSWSSTAGDGLIYATGRDVTAEREAAEALRRTEELLRQSQKMEAVGQLTGGIAHDFNNLLTGIIASLDLMQKRVTQGRYGEIERYTTLAKTSANRAASLTHRLLAFARRQPLDPKPVNVNQLVASMEELLRRSIGEQIRLDIVKGDGLWSTFCDPHQLESALLNLAINARDAMPDGGVLTIETANAHLDARYAAELRDVAPGQYVALAVSDTGVGMSPAVQARAFDPFFTTKPIGQGTGLGLSMVYGFARQSEGHAHIYSEQGQGTTVKIYLPRHGAAATEAPGAAADAMQPKARSGETVLVVEDEASVRGLVIDVLNDLGYRALEAADGPASLQVLRSRERIDLLITDVGLPGMNGRQVADAAREHRPDLKVLFITGYAESAAMANGFLAPGMEMVTKPFAIDALATRIRDMINA
jgi:signal transduction histidine kinase